MINTETLDVCIFKFLPTITNRNALLVGLLQENGLSFISTGSNKVFAISVIARLEFRFNNYLLVVHRPNTRF